MKYFTNLKSIIISSRHGLADEEFQSIIESEQFQRLESFKIKENQRRSSNCVNHSNSDSYYHNNALKKVFTNKTSLKIFEYSFVLPPFEFLDIDHLEIKDKFQSLTLI